MRRLAGLLIASVIVVTLAGCTEFMVSGRSGGHHEPSGPVVHQPGPPPHAPAHGYRRKHAQSGAEMQFDSQLGVYVVLGQTELYFSDGFFIRIRSGVWEFSASMNGPWEVRAAASVPPGLRSKKHAKKPGRGRGHGPAKGKW